MLVAAGWFAPVTAAAQEQSAFQDLAGAVRIERGLTCLDSGELVEHVASWLGTDRIAAPLAIEVHGSPYFARTVWFRILRGDTTLAERRFEPAPARCADLHAAVGLAIALALKASLLDSLIGAQSDGAHVSRPFRIGVSALGGFAVVPGASFGLSVSVQRALSERFALRLFALASLGPYGDFQTDQGTFTTWLGVGKLDVCSRLLALRSLGISACVGVAAGGLYTAGEAFPMSRNARVPYLALANALEVDIALSARWSLAIEVDLLLPLRRTSFVVRDQAANVIAAHDLAAVGALVSVGPALHF
jgi:hypothetical protein